MNPMMRMQPPPKGDIRRLWDLLGVDFPERRSSGRTSIPIPKFPTSTENKEFVFVDAGCRRKEPFNADDPISSGLQQVLFPFPGFIAKRNVSDLEVHAAGDDRRENRHGRLTAT